MDRDYNLQDMTDNFGRHAIILKAHRLARDLLDIRATEAAPQVHAPLHSSARRGMPWFLPQTMALDAG